MGKDNMPTLYKNICFGLPSDLARDAFLWATEQSGNDRMCYSAERFAREVHDLSAITGFLIDTHRRVCGPINGHVPTDEMRNDLVRFALSRHANWRMGGNKSIPYGDTE
jgi:hypothetical protein